MPDFRCEKCAVVGWLPRIQEEELYRCQGCGTLLTFLLPEVMYRGVQTHDPYCPPCNCPACLADPQVNKDTSGQPGEEN